MKKLQPREMGLVVATSVLVIVFTAYEFVIRPVHQGSIDINDQLRIAREQLMKADHLIAQKAMVEAKYEDLKGLIGGEGPDEDLMPTILSKVETAARETNIHIANMQPQRSILQKEAKFLALELEVDGQWLDIVKFLEQLQEQPNFYFINELDLEKYSDATSSLRGRIVISRMSLADSNT